MADVVWEEADAVRTLDVARVVELEQQIADSGTSLAELMDRAGAAVADFVAAKLPAGGTVCVLCGKGNNGGDGWVAARLLAQGGHRVRLVTPCGADEIAAYPAHEAAERCVGEAGAREELEVLVSPEADALRCALADADVVVDAMLGTGFHYDSLHEPARSWVAALEDVRVGARDAAGGDGKRPLVVAVDVPSGLNAQTGDATEPVVHADATVTMMAAKTGLATPRGRELRGELHVARIAPIERFL